MQSVERKGESVFQRIRHSKCLKGVILLQTCILYMSATIK